MEREDAVPAVSHLRQTLSPRADDEAGSTVSDLGGDESVVSSVTDRQATLVQDQG